MRRRVVRRLGAATGAGRGGRRPRRRGIRACFTAVPTASAVRRSGRCRGPSTSIRALRASDRGRGGRLRTARTKAVIVVHLYGYPAELPRHRPDGHRGRRPGARSTARPGALGCHGVQLLPDQEPRRDRRRWCRRDQRFGDLADRARTRRVHGMSDSVRARGVSQNFRMSELEAAWLRLALMISRATSPGAGRSSPDTGRPRLDCGGRPSTPTHAHHLVVFRSPDAPRPAPPWKQWRRPRRALPARHHPAAGLSRSDHAALPEAEAWAAECVSVPCFPEMTEAEIDRVCDALAGLGA